MPFQDEGRFRDEAEQFQANPGTAFGVIPGIIFHRPTALDITMASDRPRNRSPIRRSAPGWPSSVADARHVTQQLLWEEYRQANPDGYRYSRFCELRSQHQGPGACRSPHAVTFLCARQRMSIIYSISTPRLCRNLQVFGSVKEKPTRSVVRNCAAGEERAARRSFTSSKIEMPAFPCFPDCRGRSRTVANRELFLEVHSRLDNRAERTLRRLKHYLTEIVQTRNSSRAGATPQAMPLGVRSSG
jgi:hypothetical protein